MGTNYYLHRSAEDASEEGLHIGKLSMGWVSLRAHLGSEAQRPILSWADWRAHLRAAVAEGQAVWSEYRYAIPVEDFIADIDNAPIEDRRRQVEWIREHRDRIPFSHRERIEPGGSWLDDEQYSLYAGEFC